MFGAGHWQDRLDLEPLVDLPVEPGDLRLERRGPGDPGPGPLAGRTG